MAFIFHLAVAPTKNMDRNEWMVEKATEIGIDRITFLDCIFLKDIKSEQTVLKNFYCGHEAKP